MGNVVCLQNVQQVVQLVLQGIGKFVRAQDIVEYVDRPAVKERLKLKKTISLATAQRWMKTVGYRWTKTPTGQFVDGHERDNVVAYRQTVFLPIWTEMLSCTHVFANDATRLLALSPALDELSSGIMTSVPTMQMIVARSAGSIRVRLLCHMQKEKVLHSWWLILFLRTMDGYVLQMGRRKHECYSRPVRHVKVISHMRIS